MRHVLDTLNELSLTSGTLKKREILKRDDSPTLRKVLEYAYDPYKVFKIKQLPSEQELFDMPTKGFHHWDQSTFDMLDDLAKAKGVSDLMKSRVMQQLQAEGPKARVVWARVIKKDLRCGIDASTINKVFPDLIPDFKQGLCATYLPSKFKWLKAMWAEVKMDGQRCHAEVSKERGTVRLLSRGGIEISGYNHIRKQLLGMAPPYDFVFDGELMSGRFGDKKQQEATADYVLYDGVSQEEWDARTCKNVQKVRRAFLTDLLKMAVGVPSITLVEGRLVKNHAEFHAFFLEILAAGGEGAVLKDPESYYLWGRTKFWQKYKPYRDVDVEIVDAEEGDPNKGLKNKLGAFVFVYEGKRINVGSGFSADQRTEFWHKRHSMIGKTMEVRFTPFTEEQPLTPDGSMLFPRFRKIRTDK